MSGAPGSPTGPRGGGGLVRVVGRCITSAGISGPFRSRRARTTGRWRWTVTAAPERRAPLPVSRGHFGVVARGETIYIVGGSLTHHPNTRDTARVDVYDASNDTWTAVSSLPFPRSHFEPGTFLFGDRIFIVGGRDDQSRTLSEMERADITAYDIATDTWREVGVLPYRIRAPVAQVVGDRLISPAAARSGPRNRAPRRSRSPVRTTWAHSARGRLGGCPAADAQLPEDRVESIARITPWRLQIPLGLERISNPPDRSDRVAPPSDN